MPAEFKWWGWGAAEHRASVPYETGYYIVDLQRPAGYRDAMRLLRQFHLPLTLAVWLIPGTRFRSAGHRRAAWWGIPLLAATATAAWITTAPVCWCRAYSGAEELAPLPARLQ